MKSFLEFAGAIVFAGLTGWALKHDVPIGACVWGVAAIHYAVLSALHDKD